MITITPIEASIYYAARMPELRQRGKRWRGPCPIHGGNHDNFSVDPETGLWRCWSECGRGGNIIALEMARTGTTWRDAVIAIERIIGRDLLERPATSAERRTLVDRLEHDRRDMHDAEFWRIAGRCLAEEVLETLPEAVPDRFGPTQLLMSLRNAHGATLLAVFRDFRMREPRLTAALVYAGGRAWRRRCEALARFIAAGAEVKDAA